MKNFIVTLLLILGAACPPAHAQSDLDALEPESYFDFWLGTWDLTWQDSDGSTAHGTNRIERVLDGKVIKESFEAHSGAYAGFKGRSFSVHDARKGTWKQTWVDNQGGYLDFVGEIDGNKRIFRRTGINPRGEKVLQRMVFYDITDDSLTWDWEISEDDGKTWQLRWRIFYERADEGDQAPDATDNPSTGSP